MAANCCVFKFLISFDGALVSLLSFCFFFFEICINIMNYFDRRSSAVIKTGTLWCGMLLCRPSKLDICVSTRNPGTDTCLWGLSCTENIWVSKENANCAKSKANEFRSFSREISWKFLSEFWRRQQILAKETKFHSSEISLSYYDI